LTTVKSQTRDALARLRKLAPDALDVPTELISDGRFGGASPPPSWWPVRPLLAVPVGFAMVVAFVGLWWLRRRRRRSSRNIDHSTSRDAGG
jgi:uncharacterized protein (TIGR03382 family)